jgi:hypothetical protein
MQILPEQVVMPETRVEDSTDLVQLLKTKHGVKDPKVILVFDSNKGGADETKHPWKVRVFYHSPTDLTTADLTQPTVLANIKLQAQDKEMIRTIYPDGYIGWCGKINGVPVWIT